MPISNIVDRRSNEYDVRCDVVFEPSSHDNSIEGSTQFDQPTHDNVRGGTQIITVEKKYNTTIFEMHRTADKWGYPITAYIYDPGTAPID